MVLSGLNADVAFGQAVEAGAVAVLHKSAAVTHLLGVLRAVAAGTAVLPRSPTPFQITPDTVQTHIHTRLQAVVKSSLE